MPTLSTIVALRSKMLTRERGGRRVGDMPHTLRNRVNELHAQVCGWSCLARWSKSNQAAKRPHADPALGPRHQHDLVACAQADDARGVEQQRLADICLRHNGGRKQNVLKTLPALLKQAHLARAHRLPTWSGAPGKPPKSDDGEPPGLDVESLG
jgi:hypothetical protein